MNLIDIIIVNYNSTDYLLRCLRSVYDSLHELPAEVLIVDNASKDGVDSVKAEFPQVALLKNRYNMGFAKAINRAFEQSSAPYILLLNPDTYVMNGFFESVLGYMEDNPYVGVIGPEILNHDGSIQGSARSFPTPLTALFGRSSLLTRLFPNNPFTRANILTTKSDGKNPMEVGWVSGACMAVRKRAVDDVGLVDERFFMYWEDADWCRRMWEKGWNVVYFPQASVVHHIGVSSGQTFFKPVFEFHKSSYKLFDKYSKASLWFAKPLAIAGISLHLFYVLIFKGIRLWHEKHKFAIRHKKEARVSEKEGKINVL